MDSEKFFDALRDRVNDVRAADAAMRGTTAGTPENMRAVIDHRRNRDELTSLVSRHPEGFAGLILALAASANETYAGVNDRLARLEVAAFDDDWSGS